MQQSILLIEDSAEDYLELNLPGMEGCDPGARIKVYHIKSATYPAFKLKLQRLLDYGLTDCLLPARLDAL